MSVKQASRKKTKKSPSGEPESMEELLAQSSYTIKGFFHGQRLTAKIIDITKKSVICDIGGKSEGLVTGQEFEDARNFIKTLKLGDEVVAQIVLIEAPDGSTLLSFRQAATESAWKKVEEAKEASRPIPVSGKGATGAGVSVDVFGLSGFIPSSQLGKVASQNSQTLIGKHFLAKVVETDKLKSRLVLSEKAVSEAEDVAQIEEAFKTIKEGELYEAKIMTLANFGAFAQIEIKSGKKTVPLEGLIHVSELSWEKVGDPSHIFKVGDKVGVKIIGIKDGKLAFSVKQAKKDPWEEVAKKYKADQKIKGKITRVSDYGVFVSLEPGVEGLVHLTKIPPGTNLREAQDVDCYIEEVDAGSKKISLGLVLKAKPVGYK